MSEYDALVRRIRSCTSCTLAKHRITAVPGEGRLDADIMFIGEGPGFHEDKHGRPFVGSAGKLLEDLLASIGMKREDVYITNMIKCRAPNNRDPLPGEIEACRPYLDEQLNMIAPKVVVTLGRYSLGKFFPDESIGKARGKPRTWNGTIVYPVYHPAAALRNSKLRTILENDFGALPLILKNTSTPDAEVENKETKQLGLF